jgi:hypothetical protein
MYIIFINESITSILMDLVKRKFETSSGRIGARWTRWKALTIIARV